MRHIKDYALIILIAFVAVFCYRSYNGIKDVQVLEKTIYDTIYKTNITTVYKKGSDIPYAIIATDSIQNYVHDTVFILNDYNSLIAYSDTIKQDSNIFVIDDTITQNRIKSRSFTVKLTEKTVYVKEYYTKNNTNGLYLGFRSSFSQDNVFGVLSPGLMLSIKNKALIGLNVDLYRNGGFGYSGSFYLKIGKK